jgi:hypothetical protein
VAVALHGRPAPGSVDDDGLDPGALELVDEPPGRGHGIGLFPRVLGEGSATSLRLGHDHLVSLCREHPNGCLIHVSEEHPLHAPQEQPDAPPHRPLCGDAGRNVVAPERNRGQQPLHRLQPLGKETEDAGAMDERLEP